MGTTATRRPAAWSRLRYVLVGQVARIGPAGAAVLGLLVAAPGLYDGSSAVATAMPLGAVALVNQQPILFSDLVAQTEAETGGSFDNAAPAQRAKVLREMIDEELLVQRSLTLDLPETDTEVRQALVQGVEAQVAAPTEARHVTDDALRAFYAAHRATYATPGSMRVRDLVLAVGGYRNADSTTAQAMQDAAEAAYQLRAGTPIQAVMQHYGLVDAPRADAAAQFDFAARLHLGDALFAVAATMNSGDVSDPVERDDGVHLLVMLDRQPPRTAPFNQVRAEVYTDHRKAVQAQANAANLQLLRRDAHIQLAADAPQ